jgi:anaerobic selenocysteine-containing dehydrogenase
MRAADDLADEAADPEAKLQALEAFGRLTHAALDPIAKIPEYKVCAVRVEKAA